MTGRAVDQAARDAAAARGAELVERCLDGDESAWEALVAEYGSLVWTVARKAGLSDEDAADVYQTVWRIAVEDLSRVRRTDRVGAWLARTTHFQAMRTIRSYCTSRRALAKLPSRETDGEVPEDALVRLEERQLVAQAFAELGRRCRELLKLLYYEQPRPAYRVVADRLGMRIGSIGPTRARCLQRLEGRLSGGAS